jgi:hypothetical protein
MDRPTKQTMAAMKEDLVAQLDLVNRALDLENPALEHAMATIETFCAISLRVMSKTNLAKLRSETMTVEISARLAGRTVLDPD